MVNIHDSFSAVGATSRAHNNPDRVEDVLLVCLLGDVLAADRSSSEQKFVLLWAIIQIIYVLF